MPDPIPFPVDRTPWEPVAHVASGFEADVLVAVLEAAGIPALAQGNDLVGIFGPGFQGASARGVTVLVPRLAVADARRVLAAAHDDGDGDEDDGRPPGPRAA